MFYCLISFFHNIMFFDEKEREKEKQQIGVLSHFATFYIALVVQLL